MDSYGYQYPTLFPAMCPPDGNYPDHGDGFGEFYEPNPLNNDVGRRYGQNPGSLWHWSKVSGATRVNMTMT